MSSAAEPPFSDGELAYTSPANSSLSLPGMGERPSSCGVVRPDHFCNDCGEPHFGESRCLNRSCPECWWRWARDRAASITRRLAAARQVGLWKQEERKRCAAFDHTVSDCPDCGPVRCADTGTHGHRVGECPDCYEYRCRDADHVVEACPECGVTDVERPEGGLAKRALHVSVSAPEGVVESVEDVANGFSKAYEVAQEHGVRGGVVLFHGWRMTEVAKAEWADVEQGEGAPPNRWIWVRNHGNGWRELVEWSPHFHIIGMCDDFKAAEARSDKWVIRNLRSLNSFRVDQEGGYKDMYGLARYLLSHTGIDPENSTDSVRWYGELHPVNFNPDPTDDERQLESPLSEDDWREIVGNVADLVGEDGLEEGGSMECKNCGGESFSIIWAAGGALTDPGWVNRIGREQERRLAAAFEWAIGEREPPPGMKRPRTVEHAEEALEAIV